MEIEQKYCLEIYPEDIIERAIEDYHNICNISREIMDGDMICRFSNGNTNEKTIMLEFSNYLIELINSRSKS